MNNFNTHSKVHIQMSVVPLRAVLLGIILIIVIVQAMFRSLLLECNYKVIIDGFSMLLIILALNKFLAFKNSLFNLVFDYLFLLLATHTHSCSHCFRPVTMSNVQLLEASVYLHMPLEDLSLIIKLEITSLRKSPFTDSSSHPPICWAPFYLAAPWKEIHQIIDCLCPSPWLVCELLEGRYCVIFICTLRAQRYWLTMLFNKELSKDGLWTDTKVCQKVCKWIVEQSE